MRVVIIGAGVVGFHLARQLSLEQTEVSIIDRQPDLIQRINDKIDVFSVLGDGTSPKKLEAAGIQEADALIAVADTDTINLTACLFADYYGVPTRIARVRSKEFSDRAFVSESFRATHIVNQQEMVVEYILKLINAPGSTEVVDFADGKVVLRGFTLEKNSLFVGKRLADIKSFAGDIPVLIIALWRNDDILIPDGETVIEAGDTIYALTSKEHIEDLVSFARPRVAEPDKIVIFGARPEAIELARQLENNRRVILIDWDAERTKEASSQLQKTTVMQGAMAELGDIWDVDIQTAEFFIAMSVQDEHNMMASLLAKQRGAQQVVTVVEEVDYIPTLHKIGLQSVVNPRLVTVGSILKHLRRGRVLSVVKIGGTEAEGLEIQVEPGAKIIGQPLKDVGLLKKERVIVGSILRRGEMFIPGADSRIEAGDVITVFAMPEAIKKAELLFSAKSFFHRK